MKNDERKNDEMLLARPEEEFNELVSEAFTYYRNGDMLAFSTSPLAKSSLTALCFLEGEPITPAVRGRAIYSVLHWAIDALRPAGEQNWLAFEWRSHNVLVGFYVRGMRVYELAELIAIEETTYYKSRQRAFNAIGQLLRAELEAPQAAQQRQRYAFADRYAAHSPNEQLILRIAATYRSSIPSQLLHQLASEANGTNTQESIHNLLMEHLLESNEQRSEFWVNAQIRVYLLTLLSPQERNAWHQAAGEHYEEQQAYLEAANHFSQAGAYESAALLLISHYQAIIDNNQVADLRDLLEKIKPAKLHDNSWARLLIVAGQTAEFMGDLEGAQQKYGKALRAKEVQIKAEAYYRRAKVFELINIDEALAHYNVGIDLLQQSSSTERLLIGKMYIHRAWIFIQERQDLDSAGIDLTHAQAYVNRRDLAEWADLHNAWGGLFWRKREYAKALEHRLQAWLAANELQDLERMIKIGHNVGINYIRQRDYQRALEYLEKSRALAIKAGNRPMQGGCNDKIGVVYFWREEYEEARRYYKMAHEIHVELGNRNWLGHNCYNLAEVCIKLADRAQAQRYFDQGLAIAKELGDERLLGEFEALRNQIETETPLNPRQQKGLEYVKEHGEIAKRTYMQLIGATEKQARNDLKDLVEKGVFKKVGGGRSTRYVLAE